MVIAIQVVGVILIVTIVLFIYLNKKIENRSNEKKARLKEKHDEILELLRQRNLEKPNQQDKNRDKDSSL